MREIILSQVFESISGKSSSLQIIFFEILKTKWSTINFAVDTTHTANFSVETDSEILENAFKALYEIRYDSNS